MDKALKLPSNLGDILSRRVLWVGEDACVVDALRLMAENVASSVVVMRGQAVVGIFTEGDAVSAAVHGLLSPEHAMRDFVLRRPLTLPAHTDLREAYNAMAQVNACHVIVTGAADAIAGIVSETDLLCHMDADGPVESVSEAMTRDVASLSPRDRVADALALMSRRGIGCVVVLEDTHAKGIITNRDMVRLLGRHEDVRNQPLGEVMSRPVRTIAPDASVHDAETAMLDSGVRRLVVADGSGAVAGILTEHDIVKKLQGRYVDYLRQTIDEQAQRLRATSQHMRDKMVLDNILSYATELGIVALDLEQRVVFVNPLARTLLGWPSGDLSGQRALDIAGGTTLSLAVFADSIPALRDGPLHQIAVETQLGDRWIRARIYGIRDPHGELAGYLLLGVDITEARRAQAALSHSEERFRRITNSMRDMVCQTDAQGRFQYASPSYRPILGHDPAHLIGRSVFEFLHPEDKDSVIRAFQTALANKSPGKAEFRYLHANGEYLWIETTGDVLLDASDAVVGAVFASRDSTERKLNEQRTREFNAILEQRVAERTAELNAANRELESFSYSVSHDLSAPLRAIEGFSTLLETECAARLDAQGHDYLQRIRGAARRMAQLIDDLLDLSRVTRRELQRQPVDLSDLARSAIEELRWREPERGVEWIVADDLRAEADPTLLRAVLDNLLGNAWKFTRPQAHARIEFGFENESGEPAYFVRDNGAGFDMDYVHKLFTPFQRLHGPAQFEGNGIGLATSRHIIQRHGGKIWAESAVGSGATFRFTLGNALAGDASADSA